MYKLKNSGIIREIECNDNFAYILEKSSYFENTAYKVLQNQTNELFIRCMKMLYNGKVEIYYLTDDYSSLASILEAEDAEQDKLITICMNLFKNIIEIKKEDDFLKCENIDISLDKIFVDRNTLKVRLVYLPVSVKGFNTYMTFENELRARLVKAVNRSFPIMNDRMEQFISDLSNGSLSLEEVVNKVRNGGLRQETISIQQRASTRMSQQQIRQQSLRMSQAQTSTVSPRVSQPQTIEKIRLVALNAPEYFEIVIDADEILIGKSAEFSDKVIPYNPKISRKHCRIIRRQDEFYITDEKSLNHTYVNGMMVMEAQFVKIRKGDSIRLADSKFQVV